jgi:hypothetical protein
MREMLACGITQIYQTAERHMTRFYAASAVRDRVRESLRDGLISINEMRLLLADPFPSGTQIT